MITACVSSVHAVLRTPTQIHVVNVVHGARQWPPAKN